MKDESKPESNSRWWEFYAVRYAMGTVIGGMVFFLLASNTPALKTVILTSDNKFDAPQILLLAAYGLTYCYIASAPILVLHAGRFVIELDSKQSAWRYLGRATLLFVPPVLVAAYCWARVFAGPWKLYFVLVSFLGVLVFWLQAIIVWHCVVHSARLYQFYKLLSERRAGNKDIVESYRHLREHGNSFAIVVLEIVFGLILYSIGADKSNYSLQPSQYFPALVLAVLFWVMPAATMWLVGTLFERRFIDGRP